MRRSHHSVEFEALRLKTGLSRIETADLLGVTERTVIRYESGESRPSPIAIKWLQEHLARLPEKRKKPAAFKFIDLFAGIGGLRIGFDAIGGQCIFPSEWDKYSQATYRENFGSDHPIAGDIREYPDKKGRADRRNFGGTFLAGVRHIGTKLTMTLDGFDSNKSKLLNPAGSLVLLTDRGLIAAE